MTEKADDDAVFPAGAATSPSGAGAPLMLAPRVTFGPTAFVTGYAIACLLVAAIATVAIGWGTSRDFWGYLWIIVIAAFYAAGIGLVTAAPVGLALGLLLRGVPNQWLHVLAFFLVPTVLAWVVIGFLAGSVGVPLLMALAIGVSSAVGRLAVWRLMDVRY
ncbi:hypothetical protein [Arthrobacter koreensis]|jgi:hypothetical protein|uniref:Uncharacterized protein n=1 Tax=Arthrobacter koreensis TaxID=199136 RepID=A0ABY6FTB4_9MICC|nr:hypothetical protein [Arthrobacter koreensis]MDF2497024.1 hypothetical protein [Arthrobacter koreensis]MEB7447954.1 hypothetical protein [Arthrobacter koreensis]UYB36454.1 hypothetical protein N9A08_01845 [Arthrobacter koreensis]